MKTSPPLYTVLLAAAEQIAAVQAGTSLREAIARTPAPLRAAAQAHSFYTLRHLGLARALQRQMVPKAPKSALFTALLQQALVLVVANAPLTEGESPPLNRGTPTLRRAPCARTTEIVRGHGPLGDGIATPTIGGAPHYEVHTLVNQAVVAAQSKRALRPYKNLLNAVLRRFGREFEAQMAQALKDPVAQWNHPAWWIRRIKKAYPQQWEQLLTMANTPPPLSLRVNRRRCTVEQLLAALDKAGMAAFSPKPYAVVLEQPRPVPQIPGFEEGWWSVQDCSAQIAGELLPVEDGMRVLDACAAPGGKTAHLLERAEIELVALDSDAKRLERVPENLARLGLDTEAVTIQAALAQDVDSWWDGRHFDAILADVPCTASGIVRRHPDIRWLRRESDLSATAALQAEILAALWQTLKVGGYMLYATCSIFPEEGTQQVQAFLDAHPEAVSLSQSPGQVLPALDTPAQAGGDGFYYNLLQKTA